MQLSVPRSKAISVDRGANLDTVDAPLNSRLWLAQRFKELREAPDESARLAGLEQILHWADPGPGGFYDDLGDPLNRPHLVPGEGFESDPAFFHTIRTGFGGRRGIPWRASWYRHAEALYGNTLQLRYTGLDPAAHYKIRFVETGDSTPRATRVVANGKWEIHAMRKKDPAAKPEEYEIPAAATAGGTLQLEWQPDPAESGNGRFVQVSEVWLMRAK